MERSTARLTGVVGARPVEDPDRAVRGELVLDYVSHPSHLLACPDRAGWGSCAGCGRSAHLVELHAESEVPLPDLLLVSWCAHCLTGDMGFWPQAAWPGSHPNHGKGWRGMERPLGRAP